MNDEYNMPSIIQNGHEWIRVVDHVALVEKAVEAERERIEEIIQCATPFGIGVPQDPLISKFAVLSALTPTKTDNH